MRYQDAVAFARCIRQSPSLAFHPDASLDDREEGRTRIQERGRTLLGKQTGHVGQVAIESRQKRLCFGGSDQRQPRSEVTDNRQLARQE